MDWKDSKNMRAVEPLGCLAPGNEERAELQAIAQVLTWATGWMEGTIHQQKKEGGGASKTREMMS